MIHAFLTFLTLVRTDYLKLHLNLSRFFDSFCKRNRYFSKEIQLFFLFLDLILVCFVCCLQTIVQYSVKCHTLGQTFECSQSLNGTASNRTVQTYLKGPFKKKRKRKSYKQNLLSSLSGHRHVWPKVSRVVGLSPVNKPFFV